MKYARLSKRLDRRKKLIAQDIADIQKAYQQALPFPTQNELRRAHKRGFELQGKTAWYKEIAEMYGVGISAIQRWANEEQRHKRYLQVREQKRGKYNEEKTKLAKAWNLHASALRNTVSLLGFEVVIDHFKDHKGVVQYRTSDEESILQGGTYLKKMLVKGIKSWKVTFTPND